MFLIIIAVSEFGNYIEDNPSNYSCPIYCEIDHEHINREEEEINIYEVKRPDSTIFVQSQDGRSFSQSIERKHKYPNHKRKDRREDY